MKKTRIMITSRSYMIGLTPNEPKHNLKEVGQMFIHIYGCWSCSQKSVGHVTWKNEKGVSTIQIKTNGKAKKINPFFLFFSFFSFLFFSFFFYNSFLRVCMKAKFWQVSRECHLIRKLLQPPLLVKEGMLFNSYLEPTPHTRSTRGEIMALDFPM